MKSGIRLLAGIIVIGIIFSLGFYTSEFYRLYKIKKFIEIKIDSPVEDVIKEYGQPDDTVKKGYTTQLVYYESYFNKYYFFYNSDDKLIRKWKEN